MSTNMMAAAPVIHTGILAQLFSRAVYGTAQTRTRIWSTYRLPIEPGLAILDSIEQNTYNNSSGEQHE